MSENGFLKFFPLKRVDENSTLAKRKNFAPTEWGTPGITYSSGNPFHAVHP